MPYADPERKREHDRRASVDRWPRLKRDRPMYRLISNAKHRAKVGGFPFDLTEENVPPMPERCEICAATFDREGTLTRPTLDRVVPERGYIVANVAWICWQCNRIKDNAAPDRLRAIADYIDRKAA